MRANPLIPLFVIGAAMLAACGDADDAGVAAPTFSETIPRPATEVDFVTINRHLQVDWTTRLEGARFQTDDATLDAISRVDVRVSSSARSYVLLDVFDATLSAGAVRQRVAADSALEIATLPGYAAADDFDGDLVDNDEDNCPQAQNATQADEDADGVGTACDPDDADPSVGPGDPAVGLPPVDIELRVFAYPDEVQDGGFTLTTALLGSGFMEIVQ